MKRIHDFLKKNLLQVISITILFILCLQFFLLKSYLISIEEDYINDIFENSYNVIMNELVEGKHEQDALTNKISNEILYSINKAYKWDLDQLRYDMDNINPNSLFINKIRHVIDGYDNIIIGSFKSTIMGNYNSYNMDHQESEPYFNISWEEFANRFKNSELVTSSLNSIFSMKPLLNKDLILGIESNDSNLDKKSSMKEFSIDQFKEILREDIDSINNFQFISVSYITETGDLFQVSDYDTLGNPSANKKLIVCKLFTINDLNSNIISQEIIDLKSSITRIENKFDRYNITIQFVCFLCLIIMTILLLNISFIVESKKNNRKDA